VQRIKVTWDKNKWEAFVNVINNLQDVKKKNREFLEHRVNVRPGQICGSGQGTVGQDEMGLKLAALWLMCVPPGLTANLCVLYTQFIYIGGMVHKRRTFYFLIQN